MRVRLTTDEAKALLAAAGNVDPCMFDEMQNADEGDRLYRAWKTGRQKLRNMIDGRPAENTGRNLRKPERTS